MMQAATQARATQGWYQTQKARLKNKPGGSEIRRLWNSYKDNKHSPDLLSFCILCTRNAFVKGCCVQHSLKLHDCLVCHVLAGYASALNSGQVPTASPECSHRPPWHSALWLPARAASTWNHSQKSSTEVSLADSKAETSTLLVNHTKKPCAWVCTSGTRSTFPLPAPVSWNQTHVAQRSKGRGWSQDGKAQKPPPHCPRNFPWLTCAPLLCDSIFLPLLAVRTTVIPDGICSHVSPTQCACTRVLTCFV